MLYYSRISNAVLCICAATMILIQRDVDGDLLVNGWHGLGLVCFVLFLAGFVNMKGALDHMFDVD